MTTIRRGGWLHGRRRNGNLVGRNPLEALEAGWEVALKIEGLVAERALALTALKEEISQRKRRGRRRGGEGGGP